MKFIRKNGRIIPIRERVGEVAVGAGVGTVGVGAHRLAKGSRQAVEGFDLALTAKEILGETKLGQAAYAHAKQTARAGAFLAKSGAKIALAGTGIAGLGALSLYLARRKK